MEAIINALDWNERLSLIIAAGGLLVSIIVPTVKAAKGELDSRRWGAKVTSKGDFYFMFVLFFSLIEALVVVVYLSIFPLMVKRWNIIFASVVYYLLLVLICFLLTKFHLSRKFIRKRLLGKSKISTYITALPVVIFYFLYMASLHKIIFTPFFFIAFMIVEIIGLDIFKSDYKMYSHSYANLYFTDNLVVEEIEIDKIAHKGKWMTIKKDEKDIRMKTALLARAEYYGEPKVALFTTDLSRSEKIINGIIKKISSITCAIRGIRKSR